MNIQEIIRQGVQKAIKIHYQKNIEKVYFQTTKEDFEGDITVVIFSFLKTIKDTPENIALYIGRYLKEKVKPIKDFNIVKGFLNVTLEDGYFLETFQKIFNTPNYGIAKSQNETIMVEYSSPNTNKPLHLGHIRNNLLGYSLARILEASGKKVYKTQIINDKGIHICKSMIAWQKFGKGQTPENTKLKGDALVGKYYVEFDKVYKKQINHLTNKGTSKATAAKQAPILLEAQQMLKKWEAKDAETLALWKQMNQWVYKGFDETYKALGVRFDKNYYESQTYTLGKTLIEKGLKNGVFFKKNDGSIWIDLTDEGLDEKLVLRSDGTSVYITQDIGTAVERFKDFGMDAMIYIVGNEQDYHFKVLFLILKKLGYDWAKSLYHLSYGMVDLPSGKMKSREGTVVDADDLIQQMIQTAANISQESGKLKEYPQKEKERLYKIIGMGALKYHILKIDPKKNIVFNPKESIDFNGNTGAFIQYTYARIQSVLRKIKEPYNKKISPITLTHKEKAIIKQLENYPETVQLAAKNQSPAWIANYVYELVKRYNSFYQSSPILSCKDKDIKIFRIQLSEKVAKVTSSGFDLLGIQMPERM